MVGTGRSAHAQALLGKDAFSKIRHSRVLVVGAGGIGCELCGYHQPETTKDNSSLKLRFDPEISKELGPCWLREHRDRR